jgi:hypothetical protein
MWKYPIQVRNNFQEKDIFCSSYPDYSLKQGSQLQGQKSHNFIITPFYSLFWPLLAKILPSGAPKTLIRVWRIRIFEQSFCFRSIYMLTGDRKNEGNLHNVAKRPHAWDPWFKDSTLCTVRSLNNKNFYTKEKLYNFLGPFNSAIAIFNSHIFTHTQFLTRSLNSIFRKVQFKFESTITVPISHSVFTPSSEWLGAGYNFQRKAWPLKLGVRFSTNKFVIFWHLCGYKLVQAWRKPDNF